MRQAPWAKQLAEKGIKEQFTVVGRKGAKTKSAPVIGTMRGSVQYTGAGEDGVVQPTNPTDMVLTDEGPRMIHEGELKIVMPNGRMSVIPANMVPQTLLSQIEKSGNVPGYSSGTGWGFKVPGGMSSIGTNLTNIVNDSPQAKGFLDLTQVKLPDAGSSAPANQSVQAIKPITSQPLQILRIPDPTFPGLQIPDPGAQATTGDNGVPGKAVVQTLKNPFRGQPPQPVQPVTPPAGSPRDQIAQSQDKLMGVMTLNDPAYRNRATRATQSATAANQWAARGMAQAQAQNPYLTTGAKNANTNSLLGAQSASIATMQGELAASEQAAAINAANQVQTNARANESVMWDQYRTQIDAGDFAGAAATYKSITGQDIDTTTLQQDRDYLTRSREATITGVEYGLASDMIADGATFEEVSARYPQISQSVYQGIKTRTNTTQMKTVRANSRGVISELSNDKGNRDIAYSQVSGDLRQEIAMQTGRTPDQVQDSEVEGLFNALWSEASMTDTERVMTELQQTPGFSQYFDSPVEREQVTTSIAQLVTGGAWDFETGSLKEGYLWPWDNPETSHLFTDWDGNQVDANYDPTKVTTTIVQDGKPVTVTMADLNNKWNDFVKWAKGSDTPIAITSDSRNSWYQAMKTGKDPMATAQSQASVDIVKNRIEENKENPDYQGLAFGEGSSTRIDPEIVDYIPDIVTSITDGTWKDKFPDVYNPDAKINLTFWTPNGRRGYGDGAAGHRRTTLTEEGKKWIEDNKGKFVMFDGKPYVVLGYQDDLKDSDFSIQKIALYDPSQPNNPYVYVGQQGWQDTSKSSPLPSVAPPKLMAADATTPD
jgi:hypothetical protein